MPIPDSERERVSALLAAYCENEIPAHVRDRLQLSFRFEGNAVILMERRPPWDGVGGWTEHPVAKFRFFVSRRVWELYCRDRNLKWHEYDLARPSARFETLLAEVKADPTCIFWG